MTGQRPAVVSGWLVDDFSVRLPPNSLVVGVQELMMPVKVSSDEIVRHSLGTLQAQTGAVSPRVIVHNTIHYGLPLDVNAAFYRFRLHPPEERDVGAGDVPTGRVTRMSMHSEDFLEQPHAV